jgi:hypothetical protein
MPDENKVLCLLQAYKLKDVTTTEDSVEDRKL